MVTFVEEVRYANSALVEAVWREREALDAVTDDVRRLESGARLQGGRVVSGGAQLELLLQRAQAHDTSIAALAGAVLQIAHSGIRLVHGGRKGCPDGRLIVANFPLRDVVWQARNQAAHWEDELHPPTREVFEALRKADPKFDDYMKKNMAFNVISFLRWRSEGDVSKDLLSLA